MSGQLIDFPSNRRARQLLRGARIMAALGTPLQGIQEAKQRDALISSLAYAAVAPAPPSDTKSGPVWQIVDAAVSVALSKVNENRFARLSALLLSSQILCDNGQFARLQHLSHLYHQLAEQIVLDRPFLSIALEAFADIAQNQRVTARSLLFRSLGADILTTSNIRAERTIQNLCDILVANGLRRWLESGDTDRLIDARKVSLDHSVTSAFESSELFLSYARAAQQVNPALLLPQHESIFQEENLQGYLSQRNLPTLFRAQRVAIEGGLFKPGNCLVTIPTSAGKTHLAELKIVAELEKNPGKKIIYLAPYKLLGRQIEQSLREGLSRAHRSVHDYGADYDLNLAAELVSDNISDVAVMTPEKLDSLLRLSDSNRRGSTEVRQYLSSVILFVFDEIQILGRTGRGPRLELFLLRLRKRFPTTPLMALSGVIGGNQTLADWLGARALTDDFRPTGTIEISWGTDGTIYQRFENSKIIVTRMERDSAAFKAAAKFVLQFSSEYHPILILESTRAYTRKVIREILNQNARAGDVFRENIGEVGRRALEEAAEDVIALINDEELAFFLRNGLAIHHAGIATNLQRTIENLAEKGFLRAIATTTTAAEGVHLPFKVVIIPHLNFQGGNGRLAKDLYKNIAGRAGRAGVAIEGIVVILESNSHSLNRYIESELWNDSLPPLRGKLGLMPRSGNGLSELQTARQVESQILAWLGEPGSYTDNQATNLAMQTLSWHTSQSPAERDFISDSFESIFQELEHQNLAIAASPYRLTALGEKAKLAGLSPISCVRIDHAIRQPNSASIEALFLNIHQLDHDLSSMISAFIFEAVEVLEFSLWLRQFGGDANKASKIKNITLNNEPWPSNDELFQIDLWLFTNWLLGQSFDRMAERIPFVENSTLIPEDLSDRISFISEYFTRITQPAAWAWSAVCAFADGQGENIPTWIRRAVEFGVPTETATELVHLCGVSRPASLILSRMLYPDWFTAQQQLFDLNLDEILLARSDSYRIDRWRELTEFSRKKQGL